MDQITTYATLQTAVAGTLHRASDTKITTNVPLWIQLCEADLYDRLLLKDMESDETLTLTVGQNYVALPAGFISEQAFWLVVDSERVELVKRLPSQLPYASTNGQPSWWAIDAANVRFDCPADQAYSARLRCLKKSNLSVSNTSNALLLARPDIYFFGTLFHACSYTMDDDGARKWGTFYESAISRHRNKQSRHRSVPLRTEIASDQRATIFEG